MIKRAVVSRSLNSSTRILGLGTICLNHGTLCDGVSPSAGGCLGLVASWNQYTCLKKNFFHFPSSGKPMIKVGLRHHLESTRNFDSTSDSVTFRNTEQFFYHQVYENQSSLNHV